MSTRELRRAEVLGRVKSKTLGLTDAAKILELSYRQGQRRGYCDRGLRSMEFPGRCTRIGGTSISGSQRKESDSKERRPRRSSDACASGWRSASSRPIHRKQKVAWSAITGY